MDSGRRGRLQRVLETQGDGTSFSLKELACCFALLYRVLLSLPLSAGFKRQAGNCVGYNWSLSTIPFYESPSSPPFDEFPDSH